MDEDTKVWASIGQTINMGNYESIKLEVGVTGIPVGASPELIQERLNAAKGTIGQVVEALADELANKVKDLSK